MTKTSKTIVFFGSGPVAAASLEFISKHFDIKMVITKAVPSHHKGIAPVENLAKKINLPIIFASNKKELDDVINSHQFSSELGIIVDYGVIVSDLIIKSFKLGIINSHFSLLPQWRGADPITFSILSGQPKTGVSLMLIEPTLDTGKLLVQKSITISPSDTTPSLTTRLIKLSNELLLAYIPKYISGEVKLRQQPHPDRATYSRKLSKNDGIIGWRKSAKQIECEVRAYAGWPKSRTTLNGIDIIITQANIVDTKTDKLDIICGDKKYLSIEKIIAPSGRTIAAKDFINGYLVQNK